MGIHQALFTGYVVDNPWEIPFSSFVQETQPFTISNLQTDDIVFFSSVEGNEDQFHIPGWTSTTDNLTGSPQSQTCYRRAIVDTSFTIQLSSNGWSIDQSDNYSVVVVRSEENTITVLDQAAINTSSSGFCEIPSTNINNAALPTLTKRPLALALGFYDNDDVVSSSAPSGGWNYLGFTEDSNTAIVGAYSVAGSSGDTAPPGAGNSFGNPNNVSDPNRTQIVYLSTEDRTVKTWSVVNFDFRDIGDDGTGLEVDNLQQGDVLYWTQCGDQAGSIPTASGWVSTFSDSGNSPSFKEQVQTVGAGVTTVNVDCQSNCDVGALIAFRCSSGTATLETSAKAMAESTGGTPVVPDRHDGTLGLNMPLTSEDDCLCVVSAYLDDDQITSCSAPTGLNLVSFIGGNANGFSSSSLMVAYGVSRKQEAGPLAGGRSWTINGSDAWVCTVWYMNPS